MIYKTFFSMIVVLFIVSFTGHQGIAKNPEERPALIQKGNPSVVMVLVFNNKTKQHSQATGFFLNDKGDVVTSYHAVKNNSQVTIRTVSGKGFPGTKIARKDIQGDLAVLSVDIPPSEVHAVTLAPTPSMQGNKILVVGHPLGHMQNASQGEIIALFPIKNFGSLIQFSAPIAVGSSGSPVFNMKGEVVAVASFMLFNDNEPNFNFAIQASRLTTLISTEKITKIKP